MNSPNNQYLKTKIGAVFTEVVGLLVSLFGEGGGKSAGLVESGTSRNNLTGHGTGITRRSRSLGAGIMIVVAVVLGGAGVAAAEGLAATSRDWPMFRGGATLTGVAKSDLPKKLAVRWTLECGEAITSSAAIVDGTVYVGSEDAGLFAVDLATGKVRWQYKMEEAVHASPTVYRGVVFFGDAEGIMHAVDAKTGSGKWKFTTHGEIISSANPMGHRIVFGSYDGTLYCLSATDGKLLWKVETEGRIHGTPGVIDGHVIAAGCDEHLHVADAASGKVVPSMTLGSVTGVGAAVSGSMVYLGTYGSRVMALDWRARKQVWAFKDPDRDFPYMSSAAITGEVVVLGSRDKNLRALDLKTGKLRWALRTRGRIDSSPVIVGNRVFVGSSDGNLYEVDLTTGRERWRFEAGAPISASPAVASGCMVVGAEDGLLYCFSGK